MPLALIDKTAGPAGIELDDARAQENNHVSVGGVVSTLKNTRALVICQVELNGLILDDRRVNRLTQKLPADCLGKTTGRGGLGHGVEESVGSQEMAILVVLSF